MPDLSTNYEHFTNLPPRLIKGVVCKKNEHCKVESQETTDGSWAPPKGVCVGKSDSDDCEASSFIPLTYYYLIIFFNLHFFFVLFLAGSRVFVRRWCSR